jgi:predicted nucleic acid-binding Zn ribbon protein
MWMSKWMDDCAKHETINTDPRGMSLVVTCAPYGTQCLLFSVSGINKIIDADYPEKDISFSNYLNVGVRNNKLVGIAIHPSPIKFDTNYVRNSSIEYAKSVECADVKGEILTQKKQSNLTFFIMIVVIIVILVAIYVLIKYGSKISDAYERSAMSINKEGKVIV